MGYIWTTQLSDFSGGRELDGGIEYDSGEVTLGGTNWTFSTATTWTIIQDNGAAHQLTLSYTPPVDSWMYVDLQVLASADTNDTRIAVAIFEDANNRSEAYQHFYRTSNANYNSPVAKARLDLSAGTAYTITGKIYLLDNGPSIVVDAQTKTTKMIYRLVSKY